MPGVISSRNQSRLLPGSLTTTTGNDTRSFGRTRCTRYGGGGSGESGPVTMDFWHNATTGPGKAFWDKTVADFQTANPTVKIKIQAIQNEELDGKLQTALNSGSAPDIFFQRGGGTMAAMDEASSLAWLHARKAKK